jgi:hypothetical protein
VTALAEFPSPQSSTDAIRAPQARTTDDDGPVVRKNTFIVVEHVVPPDTSFWLTYEAPVSVAPVAAGANSEKTPGT